MFPLISEPLSEAIPDKSLLLHIIELVKILNEVIIDGLLQIHSIIIFDVIIIDLHPFLCLSFKISIIFINKISGVLFHLFLIIFVHILVLLVFLFLL